MSHQGCSEFLFHRRNNVDSPEAIRALQGTRGSEDVIDHLLAHSIEVGVPGNLREYTSSSIPVLLECTTGSRKPISVRCTRGRLRDECLNVNQFSSIEDARARIEACRIDYNHHRPLSSLGHQTPAEFVRRHITGTPKQAGFSS